VCVVCLTGRGLCDELITRPEESYRLWRVVVCDQETSCTKEAVAPVGLQCQRNKHISVRMTSQVSKSTLDHLVVFASVTALELTQFTLEKIPKVSLSWSKSGKVVADLSIAPTFKMLLHTAVTVNGFVWRDDFHVRSVILHNTLLVTRPECSEWYISAVLLPWGNITLCGASNHPEGRERSYYQSQC
jgi:hypothetical protein